MNDEVSSARPAFIVLFLSFRSSFIVHHSYFECPMFIPTNYLPAQQRVHRKRRGTTRTTPTLTLIQAVYPTESSGEMFLKFDRAIDISALDGTQIIVKDGIDLGAICQATGPAELTDPNVVQLLLVSIGDYSTPNRLLTATGASGIVAVDDGGVWGGVTDLVLPWP
jgi:hypothetical protein